MLASEALRFGPTAQTRPVLVMLLLTHQTEGSWRVTRVRSKAGVGVGGVAWGWGWKCCGSAVTSESMSIDERGATASGAGTSWNSLGYLVSICVLLKK